MTLRDQGSWDDGAPGERLLGRYAVDVRGSPGFCPPQAREACEFQYEALGDLGGRHGGINERGVR